MNNRSLQPFAQMSGLPEQAEQICRETLFHIDAEALAGSFFACRREAVSLLSSQAPGAQLGYFPDGFYPEHAFFEPAKRQFDTAQINRNTGFLAILLSFAARTWEIYREYSIPETVFRSSIGELGKAAWGFYKQNGFWGISDYVWLNCFFLPELYTVGALQFRLCAFPYERFDTGHGILHKNDPVVQLHVPEHADLSVPSLDYAYRGAYALFGIPYFLADSWLLYPPHREMLSPDSAIRRFMDGFAIIETDETDDYEGLWRIFGKKADYRTEPLACDTSLQRAYALRVKENKPIGSAVGIRYYKP